MPGSVFQGAFGSHWSLGRFTPAYVYFNHLATLRCLTPLGFESNDTFKNWTSTVDKGWKVEVWQFLS